MMHEGRIPEEQATHIIRLDMLGIRRYQVFLRSERTRDNSEEETATPGLPSCMVRAKSSSQKLLQREADKWVGVASDEDIISRLLGLSGSEDRIGTIVRPTTGPILHHIGATATIQKDGCPIQETLDQP